MEMKKRIELERRGRGESEVSPSFCTLNRSNDKFKTGRVMKGQDHLRPWSAVPSDGLVYSSISPDVFAVALAL